jgi:isopentenyl diphosphate isomerase/L-lactate dehydrogenase-like FMN-dependent dehydrogenase
MSDLKTRGYSIEAMRTMARAVLPRFVFDFADGGAEDESTLARNELAFEEFGLLPKPLNGAGARDLSVSLFGRRLSMPLIVGPTGLTGLFWPRGEECVARAAAAAGAAFCLSHGSVCTMEDVAKIQCGSRWMQIFIYKDRAFTRELAERAKQANYDVLVLTVDNQLLGKRERDIRNGFRIPPRFGPRAAAEMALKTGWLWRMRAELRNITFAHYVRPGETSNIKDLARKMPGLLDPSMSWKDVDELRAMWKGPLVLKGILHPDEAREAAERGIDGVIVSNHGGRQLDGAPASLDMLPAVAEAVGARIPVLLDGGVRRGKDVVKALALGATACLIGRPQLWGVAVAGTEGMAQVLEIFRSEIDRVMGLCGVRSIDEIRPDLLVSRAGRFNRPYTRAVCQPGASR